jgi:hypothetical protein
MNMKKIVMIVSIAIGSIGFSYAQQGQTHDGQTQDQRTERQERFAEDGREFDNNEKNRIEKEELPANIHRELNTGEYSGWDLERAYRIEDEARTESGVAYEVRVARRGVKKKLHYDERGNFLPSPRLEGEGTMREDAGRRDRKRDKKGC